MTENKPAPKYSFHLEVKDGVGGTVLVQWDNLTLLEAKTMHRLTDSRYSVQANYIAPVARYGWEEMK